MNLLSGIKNSFVLNGQEKRKKNFTRKMNDRFAVCDNI